MAIRYNPEQHTFDRHTLKDTKVRSALAGGTDGHALERCWRPYLRWGSILPCSDRCRRTGGTLYAGNGLGADDLVRQTIVAANAKPAAGVQYPDLGKKSEPEFTSEAEKDRVKGTVQLKVVVGMDGVPRRIAIRQPLGHGLDQPMAEAVIKYRFEPGTQGERPVAMEVVVNQAFDVGTMPR